MSYSGHIIYVDESGDHSLSSIDPHYPVFVLAFCILRIEDYVRRLVPEVQAFKFRWFGHDCAVLHEHEIRRAEAPFVFLGNKARKEVFMAGLTRIVEEAPMVVVSAVIPRGVASDSWAFPPAG
jgi:hypothetical protein